jgi:hypothetical protein
MDKDAWLIDKTRNLLWALAEMAEYCNGIPNYQEEDETGRPTRESWLVSVLHNAVNTATTIFADAVGVEWEQMDRDRILRYGQVGRNLVLLRYGLITPPKDLPVSGISYYQSKPLEAFDSLEDRWSFATFDVARLLQGSQIWDGAVIDEIQQRELLAQGAEQAYRYALHPRGLLLIAGLHGAGKSHLAGAIIQEVLKAGMMPLYLSALTIAYRYKSPEDPEWLEYQPRFETADLLVVDNLSLEDRLVWNRYIEHILRTRDQFGRPTVLVSVRSRANLPAWLSAIVTEVSVIASDYRQLLKRNRSEGA